jgi:predicted DNA-binding protein
LIFSAALLLREIFRSLKGMEVHFSPETEKKLNDLAALKGRGSAAELVQDVVEGYFAELIEVRQMLDSRYDDLESGRVQPIDGEEAFKSLIAKTKAQRNRPA